MATPRIEKPNYKFRLSAVDTLKEQAPGTEVTYDCRTLGNFATVQGYVSKFNKAAGRKVYAISSADNGATYTVTRYE